MADKEDERVGRGGGWATLLLACLPLGLETCYITTPLLSIDLVKISKTKLATLAVNLVTLDWLFILRSSDLERLFLLQSSLTNKTMIVLDDSNI